jgi:flagellar biosynthetic protein FliQ
MNPSTALSVGEHALYVMMLLAAPLLLSALAAGLLIGMFQAATQINEMTLSFIPKLIVLAVALLVAGPLMLRTLIDFTKGLFHQIPGLIG